MWCECATVVIARTIVVTKYDAPNTVVWNPGPRGAAEFADMAPDEWVQFLCVEPGRIRENAAKLEPGESFSISMSYLSRICSWSEFVGGFLGFSLCGSLRDDDGPGCCTDALTVLVWVQS